MSRILMTMIRPQSYGASRMAMYYALALTKAGHEVVVAYAVRAEEGKEQNSILPELHAAGVKSLHVAGLARFGLPRVLTPLFAAASTLQPDIIISINVRDAPAAMQTAKRLSIPGIVFALNMPRFAGLPGLRHLKTWLYRHTLRTKATHVICCASGIARDLTENGSLDPARTSVVPNGIRAGDGNPDRQHVRREVRDELGLTDEIVLLDLTSFGFTMSCIAILLAGIWCGLGGSFRTTPPRLLVGTDLDQTPWTGNGLLVLLTLGNLASCAIFIRAGGLIVIRAALQGQEALDRGMRDMSDQSGGQLWLTAIVLSSVFAPAGYQMYRSVSRHPVTRPLFVLFIVIYIIAAMLGSRRNYIARPLFGILLVWLVWPPVRRRTLRKAVLAIAGAGVLMFVVFAVFSILRRGLEGTSEVLVEAVRYLLTPYNTQSLILHDIVRMPGAGTAYYWTEWLWQFPVVAFNVSGMSDAVTEDCGVLVRPESIDDLASALAELLAAPDRRTALAAAARRRAETVFDIRWTCERVAELYGQLTATSRTPT